jgi:hypothetical protein
MYGIFSSIIQRPRVRLVAVSFACCRVTIYIIKSIKLSQTYNRQLTLHAVSAWLISATFPDALVRAETCEGWGGCCQVCNLKGPERNHNTLAALVSGQDFEGPTLFKIILELTHPKVML